MNQLPALQSADYGVGERIIKALFDLDTEGNAVLDSVKKRGTAQWIQRIPEGVDIKTVVRALAQASNKRALPAVLYSRARGLNTSSPDQVANVKGGIPFESSALKAAKVDITWFDLSYSIITVANSREEAEALMLMWYFHVSRKDEGNHKVVMNYELEGDTYPLDAYIADPTALFAGDFSLPEEHLYGLKQDFIVQAPLLYGEIVDVPPAVRIGLDFKGRGFKVDSNAG